MKIGISLLVFENFSCWWFSQIELLDQDFLQNSILLLLDNQEPLSLCHIQYHSISVTLWNYSSFYGKIPTKIPRKRKN